MEIPLLVDLKDLFLGKVVEVEVDKQFICSHCDGSGAKSANDVKTCTTCGGHGVRIMKQMIAPGFVQQIQTTYVYRGGGR